MLWSVCQAVLASCPGTLYDLEHQQDCSGHHMFVMFPEQVMDMERAVGTFLAVDCM